MFASFICITFIVQNAYEQSDSRILRKSLFGLPGDTPFKELK